LLGFGRGSEKDFLIKSFSLSSKKIDDLYSDFFASPRFIFA